MRKTIGILFVFLLLALTGRCMAETEMTLLVYMTGSDLESQGQAASRDLEEMAAALPADGSIRIAVMASGAARWQADVSVDETAIYEVHPHGIEKVIGGPLCSMGKADTLTTFLRQATEHFPASSYALILWDHGAGPLMGLCFDELFEEDGSMDHLTLGELEQALADSPFAAQKLRFIGFDACLMASAEVACAMAPYADYMIASQEPEPATGWDYRFLSQADAGSPGDCWGRQIIDTYAAAHADHLVPITLSMVDLSRMDELNAELSRTFAGLVRTIDRDSYRSIAQCRNDTKALGCSTPAQYDLVDLKDLLLMLQDAGVIEGETLLNLLDETIVCYYANQPYTYGLSIFSPFENKAQYMSPWAVWYDELPFAEGYQQYVHQFAEIWLGEALIDWQSGAGIQGISAGTEELISLTLTHDQASMLANARYQILERIDREEYVFLFGGEDMRLFNESLFASYNGQALYMVNPDGEAIAGPCAYREVEGGIAVGALLEDDSLNTIPVYLQYQTHPDGTLVFTGILTYQEGIGMYVPSALTLDAFSAVTLVSWGRTLPEADAPFEDWPYGEHVLIDTLNLDGEPLQPAFLPLSGAEDRYVMIVLTDLQGNVHCEGPRKLEADGTIPIDVPKQTVQAGPYRITLESAAICNGVEPGLKCVFHYENGIFPAEQPSVRANQTLLPDRDLSLRTVSLPDVGEQTLLIPASALQHVQATQLETLTLALAPNSQQPLEAVFQLPLHLGMLVTGDMPKALATHQSDTLSMQLLNASVADDGKVSGNVRVINTSSLPCRLDLKEAYVNGIPYYGDFTSRHRYFILPAGCEAVCSFRLYIDCPDDSSILSGGRLSSIRQLTFVFSGHDTPLSFSLDH